MLYITIPGIELWDPVKEEFSETRDKVLQMEHSLVSLSKWESKFCKPFLSKDKKTYEETMYYIRCMTITQNVTDDVYQQLTNENFKQINNYIKAPMTATSVPEKNKYMPNREQITSELIYYWMVAFNIPFECQRWHLNRLLTLIKVCSYKNQPKKKMKQKDLMTRNTALNAARKQQFNTRG